MTLVSDSSQLSGEVGTARLGSPSAATEIETSFLPHTTDAVMSRSTAPTTVLPTQSPPSTGALAKPKHRRTAIAIAIIVAAVVVAAAAMIVNSYLSRRSNASIQSVAVMPFVNASGNADLDYLSDGMTETLISNQLSDAHASLGYQLMLDYDFVASEREFRRAIELDPNNARAYQWNGSRLMMIGLYDQALASFDRAIEIEPTLPDIRNNRGGCLVAAGRIDDGIAEIKKSMELDPTFPWTHSHISYVYRMEGDRAASVAERARAFELLDRADQARKMRDSFATSGWTAYLREIVSQDWGRLGTSETRRASLLAELGEKEKAIASLNHAAAKGDYWLFSIKYDPAFDPLRGDPRFQELLKKFNPPQ
jgi:tetratricopeptide (TPR) repeat protein